MNDDERDPAWLSGVIEDGQARINLANVVGAESAVESEVAVIGRLLTIVGEDEGLADSIAQIVQTAFSGRDDTSSGERILPATIDDLLITDPKVRAAMEKLRPYINVLPVPTPVNANTAPAEVLAARFEDLRLADARRLVASRDRASFKDVADATSRLSDVKMTVDAGKVAVATRFFLLEGSIEFRRARLRQAALLKREPGRVDVVWLREVRT